MNNPVRYKILFCIRQGTVGGGESHLIDLVEFLDKEKFEPIILSFSDGAMIKHFQEKNVAAFVIPSEKPFDMKVRSKVGSLLDSVNPDLIHIHGTRAFSNLYLPSLRSRIPIVYTVHGWSFNSNQSWHRKFLAIQSERLFAKRANRIINVSFNNQKTGKEHIKKFKSEVIHNGVNLKVFDKNKSYPSIRTELGIPEDAFLIGFIARLTIQKDPITLIHAFSDFLKVTSTAHLLLVGDGDLKTDCINLVSKLQINDRVTFQPFRKDIPAILKSIDVFCLPSLWEGFSIGLLEAMAMSKAVVATGVDGTLEILENSKNGLLIAKKNTNDVMNKLSLLNSNSDFKKKLEENAYQTITSEFSAQQVSKRTEKIYSDLLTDNLK
ncbi:MAG: glycosyltransferase family 4 protein [Cyclobacteriaceae bacterium]|nr:glycosyltransferase family 4 protein [Cyclobacteriaceae bacterium]